MEHTTIKNTLLYTLYTVILALWLATVQPEMMKPEPDEPPPEVRLDEEGEPADE